MSVNLMLRLPAYCLTIGSRIPAVEWFQHSCRRNVLLEISTPRVGRDPPKLKPQIYHVVQENKAVDLYSIKEKLAKGIKGTVQANEWDQSFQDVFHHYDHCIGTGIHMEDGCNV